MSKIAVRPGYAVKARDFEYVVLNVNPVKNSVILRQTRRLWEPVSGRAAYLVEVRLSSLLTLPTDIQISPPMCPKEALS